VAQLTIKAPSGLPSSILENGVGQGAALQLRLIAPTDAISPAPFAPADTIQTGPAFAAPAVASGNSSVNSPNLSAGLFVSLGGNMVGRPTPGGDSVAPVGPSVNGSSIALASSSVVLQQGIDYRFGTRARSIADAKVRTREAGNINNPPGPALSDLLAINARPVAGQPGPMALAINPGWLSRLLQALVDGLAAQVPTAPVADLAPTAPPTAIQAPEPAPESDSSTIKLSTLSTSIGLGLAVVLVVHNRRWFHRFLWSKPRRYATLAGTAREMSVHAGAK